MVRYKTEIILTIAYPMRWSCTSLVVSFIYLFLIVYDTSFPTEEIKDKLLLWQPAHSTSTAGLGIPD